MGKHEPIVVYPPRTEESDERYYNGCLTTMLQGFGALFIVYAIWWFGQHPEMWIAFLPK